MCPEAYCKRQSVYQVQICSCPFRSYAQRQVLQHCYQLPFYGCAFFRGILYKPSSIFTAVWNLDRGGVDATFPVTIAVSLRGVCLLDLSTAAHLPGSLILCKCGKRCKSENEKKITRKETQDRKRKHKTENEIWC